MYDPQMAHSVLIFLSNNPEKYYKLKDLTYRLAIKKHQRNLFKSTLQQLKKQGKIKLQNRGYAILLPKKHVKKTFKKPKEDEKKLIIGEFDAGSLARNYSYAFVLSEEGDVFVSSEDLLNCFHGDKVAVEITKAKGNKKYGIIRKIIERKRTKFAGRLLFAGKKVLFEADSGKIHKNFTITEVGQATAEDKVVVEIINWGTESIAPTAKVVSILGKAGDPKVEILSVITHFDLPMDFDEQIYREVKNLDFTVDTENLGRRKDYRELLTFTIDPVSAKDYDDAISFIRTERGFRLYVHIADVSHYVKPKSRLWAEAVKRGNSYYFPKMVIPMLPFELSNQACSLRPDEDKYTITVVSDFDHDFKLKKQKAWQSIIRSDARLCYEEVDDYFDGKDVEFSTEIKHTLDNLRILSQKLSKERTQKGYLFFYLPETRYIFNEEGYIDELACENETESHTIIENCMLLANKYVAELLTEKANTTMYRIHAAPDDSAINKLKILLRHYGYHFKPTKKLSKALQDVLKQTKEKKQQRVFDRIVLRSMKKAKYSTELDIHFGLAMKPYTHFTSPIRRVCDLVVHHQLKKWLEYDRKLNKGVFTYDNIKKIAFNASKTEKIADEAEREVNRRNMMLFMKKHLGNVFEGVIIGMNSSKMIIELDDMPVVGIAKLTDFEGYHYDDQYKRFVSYDTGETFQLATKVEVQVASLSEDIIFEVVNKIEEENNAN